MDYLLQLFKALANNKRIKIIEYLIKHGEAHIEVIAEDLKIPLTTCCRNLKILEKVYLVFSKIKNGKAFYKIKNPAEHPYRKILVNLMKYKMKREYSTFSKK